MFKVLIIGYGNPLREDDGIGWEAVRRLKRIHRSKYIQFLTPHQLTPELSESLSRVDLVIFIDAHAGNQTGLWQLTQLTFPFDNDGNSILTHQVSPKNLLAGTKVLYGKQPDAYVISMETNRFGIQEGLSKPIQAAFPKMIKAISKLIEDHTSERRRY